MAMAIGWAIVAFLVAAALTLVWVLRYRAVVKGVRGRDILLALVFLVGGPVCAAVAGGLAAASEVSRQDGDGVATGLAALGAVLVLFGTVAQITCELTKRRHPVDIAVAASGGEPVTALIRPALRSGLALIGWALIFCGALVAVLAAFF